MQSDAFRLEGLVAIVTGGAGGIGVVYARALADAGASVAIADINGARAEESAAALRAEGLDVVGVTVDVTEVESTLQMAATVTDRFGGIDILVNNAALMAEIPFHPLASMPVDVWDRVLRVNLTGYLLCAQAVVPSMRERNGGRIVNQSSGGAFKPGGVYGISKYAVVHLTSGLAMELGPSRITVNAIAPGAVETEAGFRAAPADSAWRQQLETTVPLHASSPPEGLVGTLLLLVSPAGEWITGQTIAVDGGWVMRL